MTVKFTMLVLSGLFICWKNKLIRLVFQESALPMSPLVARALSKPTSGFFPDDELLSICK